MTHVRSGPGTLSTFIWALFALGTVLSTLLLIFLERILAAIWPHDEDRRVLTLYVYTLLLLVYASLYVYFVFQRRCRPWLGFALYLLLGMLTPPLLLMLVPTKKGTSKEEEPKTPPE